MKKFPTIKKFVRKERKEKLPITLSDFSTSVYLNCLVKKEWKREKIYFRYWLFVDIFLCLNIIIIITIHK